MKLLLDQNLLHHLVALFATEFPNSQHDMRAWQRPPIQSCAYAAKAGFVIVSKDTDFQQRAVLRGHPPKVVWVRLGNCSTTDVANL